MEYPVSRVLAYDINIGKHVFQRSYDNKTGHLTAAKFIAYYFTVFIETPLIKLQIENFENTIAKLVIEHNANSKNLVELLNHGSYSVTNDLQKGLKEWLQYVLLGNFCFKIILLKR